MKKNFTTAAPKALPKKRCGIFKKAARFLLLFVILILIAVLGLNACVVYSGGKSIVTKKAAESLTADCILVPGCGVHGYTPSLMLQDRLDTAVSLYRAGKVKKIIVSGDHREDDYNEVGVMKAYAMKQGVPGSAVFMDHEGYCTYDSLYLAKNKFGCQSVIIVTQPYHLYRALYTASALGLTASGVAASGNNYKDQLFRDLREIAARNKDFLTMAFLREKPYSGTTVSLQQIGNVTNDAAFTRICKAMQVQPDE